MTTDLSDTEAVEYCTCLSADVGEKDIKKLVEVVGTDLSDTEAVEYCTCLSADVGEKDIKKLVEVVGGRFSDLRRACRRLKFFSVQSVLKVMYFEVAETVFALELVMPQDLKDEHIVLSIARKMKGTKVLTLGAGR